MASDQALEKPLPEERTSRLGTDALLPLLVRFSLPAIVGTLVNALYNIVDRIFVGQTVGSLGIAAIAINFPIAMLMVASSVIVGVGGNALFAIRMGEGKKNEAEKVFGNSAVLLVAVPLVLSLVIALFIDPILMAIGASPNTLSQARDYTLITLVGATFSSFSHGMTHFIRTDGHPRTAMLSQIVAAAVNIFLDALFVPVLGWGVVGAAWATVIAQVVGTIYVLVYFLSPLSTVKLRPRNFRIDWQRIALPFMFLGLPHFFMQIASSVVNTVLNRSLGEYGGDLAVSAVGIVISANSILILPMMGISMGSQPILGFNFGARKFHRVIGTYRLGCIAAIIYGAFTWCLSFFCAPEMVSIFTKDDRALIQMASTALPIFNMMLPVIGFQMMTSTLLQSIGQPMRSLGMSLSRQVLILIPLLFALPKWFGLKGIYMAYPTSDFLSALLGVVFGVIALKGLKSGTIAAFTMGQDKPNKSDATRMNSSRQDTELIEINVTTKAA